MKKKKERTENDLQKAFLDYDRVHTPKWRVALLVLKYVQPQNSFPRCVGDTASL